MAKGTNARKSKATAAFTGASETTVNVPVEIPQINTTTPICTNTQPQEYAPPQNSNTPSQQNTTQMNNSACQPNMQQTPTTDTNTCTTGACCTSTQNLTLPQRINQLSKEQARINNRMSWQEKIHGNVLENGNVTHFYNIVPTIIIATTVGGVVAFIVTKIFTKKN